MCTTGMPGTQRNQKGLGSLATVFRMVMSHYVGNESQTHVLCKCSETSPALTFLLLEVRGQLGVIPSTPGRC